MRVVVLADRYARSFPDHAWGTAAELLEPWDVFTRAFSTDAHFAAYELPEGAPRRRLSGRALDALTPSMVLLVADVDPPDHEATAAWRASIAEKAARLPGAPFGYWTRGGARFVWTMDPHRVTDADAWSRWYLLALVAIAAETGIVADPACCDWTRLYRAPHATRDGELQAHGAICGDAMQPGRWAPSSMSEAEVLATLGWLEAQSESWRRRARRFDPPAPVVPRPRVPGDASRAVAWAERQVSGSGKGDRNAELFRRTRFLAHLVERGELAADVVREAMGRAGKAAGLTPGEVRRTVESALRGAA